MGMFEIPILYACIGGRRMRHTSWRSPLGLAALGEAADAMVVCVFVPFIVLYLQLAIYCNTPGYKAHATWFDPGRDTLLQFLVLLVLNV